MIDASLIPAVQEAGFSPEEENLLKARLFTLLARQVRLKTQGDHSSLREEDAAELIRSLLFTLTVSLQRNGRPMRALLTADLRATLTDGQQALRNEINTAQTLYTVALRSVAVLESRALADTLQGIGLFFRQYDVLLYAHAIPASIDYPLCAPVEETLQGVLYIRAYLERLLMENRLISRFAPDRVTALLRRASPDYRELLQNLYEPVAANVVGLTLLHDDAAPLRFSCAQAAEVYRRLSVLSPAEARARLAAAAREACKRLDAGGAAAETYLARAAEALYPRLLLSPQSACGVFAAR